MPAAGKIKESILKRDGGFRLSLFVHASYPYIATIGCVRKDEEKQDKATKATAHTFLDLDQDLAPFWALIKIPRMGKDCKGVQKVCSLFGPFWTLIKT